MSTRTSLHLLALALLALPLGAQGTQGAQGSSATVKADTVTARDSVTVRVTTPDSLSLNGEWLGSIETPGASMPFNIVINARGDTLSGTVKRSSGDVPLTGSVRGDTLTFSYTIDYNGNPFTVYLQGLHQGSALQGQADYGEGYLLGFNLKKKPKAADK